MPGKDANLFERSFNDLPDALEVLRSIALSSPGELLLHQVHTKTNTKIKIRSFTYGSAPCHWKVNKRSNGKTIGVDERCRGCGIIEFIDGNEWSPLNDIKNQDPVDNA